MLAAGRKTEAAVLGNAIFQFGWDPIQRRIKPGVRLEDAATAIDVSGSWGATFLRSTGRMQEALDSLGYSASVMRASSFNDAVQGYGDIAGPYTPAVEFAAQAIAAGIKDSTFVMDQLIPLQVPSTGSFPGAFPGAVDHWYGGPLNPWVTTMTGVSPTAWMYFAACCDPLQPLVPFTNDPVEARLTPISATHITELRRRIDALGARFGRAPFDWTHPALSAGTVVFAQHIIDLRGALHAVYVAAERTPPDYDDKNVIIGVTPVRAIHIQQLRAAAIAIE